MTAIELLDLLQYPKGRKWWLQPYEKSFINERAIEEKLSENEMKKLKQILADDGYREGGIKDRPVYNLETGEETSLYILHKETNLSMPTLDGRIKNKVCIRNIPYSYDRNDGTLFYRLRHNDIRYALYRCEELNMSLSDKGWKEYFNDPSLKMAYYGRMNRKYKGYTFKGTNLYIDYIGGRR